MITGVVSLARREARVPLIVQGTGGRDDATGATVDAVLDTGFTEYLSLPQATIDALGLPFARTEETFLPDGSIVECGIYVGVVIWDGQERTITDHHGPSRYKRPKPTRYSAYRCSGCTW